VEIIIINRQKTEYTTQYVYIIYIYIIKNLYSGVWGAQGDGILSFVCQEGVMGVYYVVVTGSGSSSSKIVHVYIIYCVE